MSEVKRYRSTCDCMAEMSWGDYVLASEYDKQPQEIERLNALLSRDPNVIVTELRQTRLSIDTPNQYKQDLIDCIIGAMAFGFQNTNPPPEGHWGKQFWDIGREEGNRQAELEAELSQLKSRQSGVVVERDAHWFSLVMGCAADLEQAAIGIYDEEAKRIANSGAEHYRKRANEAWQARAALSAPSHSEQAREYREARVVSYRPGMGEVTFYVSGGVPSFMDIGCTIHVAAAPSPGKQQGSEQ